MTQEDLRVGNNVKLTSKRFGYSNSEQKWIVINIGSDYIELTEDDSFKIELAPARGRVKLRIYDKFLPYFNIKKV